MPRQKLIAIICLVVGALPLPVYPGLLVANIMGFAATGQGSAPLLLQIAAKGFFLTSTLYPAAFLVGLVLALWHGRKDNLRAMLISSVIPLIYLAVVLFLFILWVSAE
ncbi:MAG: hypothetical protein AAGI08_10685 [Bacteroidota bacterium]